MFGSKNQALRVGAGLAASLGLALLVVVPAIGQAGGDLIPPDELLLRRGTDPPSPPDGPALFVGNCATCHDNRSIGQDNPSDNASIILRGVSDGPNGVRMPSFADFLTDQEIATLANFLAQRLGGSGNLTAAQVAQMRTR
jgi:mono/diheme cytochrome c family protein